jgi:hypothetical protein
MRASIASIFALVSAAAGVAGCMPTDVGFTPPTDVDGDCQVLNTAVIVHSASDARSLPQKCFVVAGEVSVVGTDLTDLEALAFLRQAKILRIRDNEQLRSLSGLDQVKVTDTLEIDNNPMLEDLNGLDRTDVVARVTINKNSSLIDLGGLRSLREVGAGGLLIGANDNLDNLDQLETLERIEGAFKIERNGSLRDLATYRRLESVGELVISQNRGLPELRLNVAAVQRNILITDNSELLKLSAFSDLQTVGGNVIIERNQTLGVLNGFTAKFRTVGGNLSIDGNVSLTDIYELAVNLYAVGGSVIATNNTSLSRCRAEDLDYYIEEIGGLIDIGDNGAEWDPCH